MKISKNSEAYTILKLTHSYFSTYVLSIKTNSTNTARNHKTAVSLYIDFLMEKYSITAAELNSSYFCAKYLEEWLIWLKECRGNSNETCNIRLASIRSYIRYLANQDISFRYLIAEQAGVSRLKQKKRHIKGISKEAVKVLLSIPDIKTRSGKMYLVLLTTIYALALRIDEALSIRLSDLHEYKDGWYITITGKGNKVRTLKLIGELSVMMKRYIEVFHSDSNETDYLFYTKHKGKGQPMSQNGVRQTLRRYAEQAHIIDQSIPLNLHPHQLRHSRATHLLEDGLNIVQLSEFLGHNDISTTMVYLDVSDEMRNKAIEKIEKEHDIHEEKKWKQLLIDETDIKVLMGLR